LLLAGCGSDDGAGVRSEGSASGSGTGSGSGPGSGSGLANQDLSGTTNDQLVLKAVADYKTWVVAEVDGLVADTAKFTDAVRAGDVAEAKKRFAPSRVRWERIEPIAGLVEEIDGAVDARVDDFEGVNDPTFTGWHRLEYHLWEKNSTAGTKTFADRLDKDIATLDQKIKGLEFPPAAVALGPAELIEEVSEGKITGEEDRYSHTDLSDFDANVDGSKKLFELLTPALQAKDAALTSEITAGFAAVDKSLSEYANPDGSFKPYTALQAADKTRMQAELAGLSEKLASIPGVLGLKG
ncbi:MAG: iron uptake system protein EfeO, partial [Actinomycetota bacterium]